MKVLPHEARVEPYEHIRGDFHREAMVVRARLAHLMEHSEHLTNDELRRMEGACIALSEGVRRMEKDWQAES